MRSPASPVDAATRTRPLWPACWRRAASASAGVSGGGTVDYVGPSSQDFIERIEEREKAGTPGVLQILKAGMAFQLKDRIGTEAIEAREALRSVAELLDEEAVSAWEERFDPERFQQ